jgi:myosin heavy subunit
MLFTFLCVFNRLIILQVEYHVDGMLDRNRDKLSQDFVQCLSDSENQFVQNLVEFSR